MTLPTHYTGLIKTLNAHFDAKEREVTDKVTKELTDIVERRRRNTEKITEFTARYMETGVFISESHWATYEKPDRSYGGHYTTTLNKYAQELAHSLKRPFVRLYSDTLIVPKTKKLSVLTTPLMFVAQKCDRTYNAPENCVVEIPHYTTFYKYWFRGEIGLEWKNRWLEYIKEPECRAALGLLTR